MKLFLTYTTADAAKQTGIVQFFNAAANMADDDEFTEMNARYEGKSVVVTITGDNETIFDRSVESGGEGLPTEPETSMSTDDGSNF